MILHLCHGYETIFEILPPQPSTEHVPFALVLPFAILTISRFWIKPYVLQLMQYPLMAVTLHSAGISI
tara:strand:- start:10475 stop:10678 length:204 start_codon:yes stop_codon:yes gene_type:complete